MAVLRDHCPPSSTAEIDAMFRQDFGKPKEAFCKLSVQSHGVKSFVRQADVEIHLAVSEFDPNPIGVASIAQVHRAVERDSGRPVAVKLQHPDLQEFADIDLKTVKFAVHWVDSLFPAFEFGWLAAEMEEMLPKEMDFSMSCADPCRVNVAQS